MTTNKKAMRDVLVSVIHEHMRYNNKIFFLTADFGSPALDALRTEFGDRFRNVGIAEQNLINIATGLALEGFIVFAYAIAPFITMRAFEQIRTNLSLHATFKKLNVNMIGVGAGISYDISGPTHHCLEDITLMRMLPNIEVISPSDWRGMDSIAKYCTDHPQPKYIRLDSKPLPPLKNEFDSLDFKKGFHELITGGQIAFVTTGYMTHVALTVSERLRHDGIQTSVIDLFLLKSYNQKLLCDLLKQFHTIIILEEAFIKCGGIDTLVADLLLEEHINSTLIRKGFDRYYFENGGREYLHSLAGIDASNLYAMVKEQHNRKTNVA